MYILCILTQRSFRISSWKCRCSIRTGCEERQGIGFA